MDVEDFIRRCRNFGNLIKCLWTKLGILSEIYVTRVFMSFRKKYEI